VGWFSDYTGPQEFRDLQTAREYAWDATMQVAGQKQWPVDWTEWAIEEAIEKQYQFALDKSGEGAEGTLAFWLALVSSWDPYAKGAPDGWLDLYNVWALAGQATADGIGYDALGNFDVVIGGVVVETAEDAAELGAEVKKTVSVAVWPLAAGLVALVLLTR